MTGWRESALCAQTDPELFFPEQGGRRALKQAKRICADCEVRSECLEWALTTGEPYGVWGGLSDRERRRILAARRRRTTTVIARRRAEQIRAAQHLHATGLGPRAVAARVGVTERTINRWMRSGWQAAA